MVDIQGLAKHIEQFAKEREPNEVVVVTVMMGTTPVEKRDTFTANIGDAAFLASISEEHLDQVLHIVREVITRHLNAAQRGETKVTELSPSMVN